MPRKHAPVTTSAHDNAVTVSELIVYVFEQAFTNKVLSYFLVYNSCFFFFFSSRRRHTRFKCDWSSDVCSSDLPTSRTVGEKWAAPVAAGMGEGVVTAGQQMEQATGENQQRNALAALGAGALTGDRKSVV